MKRRCIIRTEAAQALRVVQSLRRDATGGFFGLLRRTGLPQGGWQRAGVRCERRRLPDRAAGASEAMRKEAWTRGGAAGVAVMGAPPIDREGFAVP